ncbi:MAG: TolC family outer membrane protein [Sphingomonadaceae bacterium]|nr:TolC family outer membrane protein [Sphingomonadaceae bacterium]
MRRAGLSLAVIALASVSAHAATLRDALVQTYASNPTLTAARAGLRATDETVGIAKAPGRPQASANGQFTRNYEKFGNLFEANPLQGQAGGTVTVPIYQGGRVLNATRAAKARVEAGRADLRGTEGDTFTNAVGAYMDVIRDISIVQLNANNVKVLETNLQATKDRFQVGDVTRTDVAQSQARLSDSRTQLDSAQSQLTASQENYLRIVGTVPNDLQAPPPLPTLPDTPDRAVEVALDNNPTLISIAAQVKAAHFDVGTARGDRLPTLSAVGSGGYTHVFSGSDPLAGVYNNQVTASIGLQATVPLYQGGLVGAEVRRAQALESQLLEQRVAVERQVIDNARAAFASYHAALAVIDSSQVAVNANTLALEGARAENSVGTRTVLDVLNAEQELLNSQVQLVTAQHDAYVAGFALLNAMGQAEARYLGLDGGPLYDPTVNYNRVSKRISDWSDDPQPVTQATRTVPAVVGTPQPPKIGPMPEPPPADSDVTAPRR